MFPTYTGAYSSQRKIINRSVFQKFSKLICTVPALKQDKESLDLMWSHEDSSNSECYLLQIAQILSVLKGKVKIKLRNKQGTYSIDFASWISLILLFLVKLCSEIECENWILLIIWAGQGKSNKSNECKPHR